MDIGMYQSAASLNVYEQWQNNVAHNLANVTTAGFKSRAIGIMKDPLGKINMQTYSPFDRLLLGSSPEAVDKVNHKPGVLVTSGKATDFAIEGDGFFEVRLPDGETMYTRSGEFHFNSNQQMVTADGYQVLGQSNEPIRIEFGTEEFEETFRVNRFGEIFQGNNLVETISIVGIDNKEALTQREGGFVLTGDAVVAPLELGTYSVYQGIFEGSNTNAMRELSNMITLSRAYESNVKVIQTFDNRYGQTISALSAE